MSSLLTNIGAMTALQTLSKTSSNLLETQDRISTGMRVAEAKDNAAYWSIATTMRGDSDGFSAISESISLASATAGVASAASDSVVDMLNEMKQRIVAGQEDGVDPDFIQNEIEQFIGQIDSIVGSAQFNGNNLLQVDYAEDGSARNLDVEVLASLDRTDTGVSPRYIEFDRQDMRTESIVGQATIEQEVVSTNALKASVGLDVGAPGATFINGQNLGLGNVDFVFNAENGTAVNVRVDLSGVAYNTDEATTEADILAALQAGIDADMTAAGLAAGDVTVAFDGNNNLTFTVADDTGLADGNFTSSIEQLWIGSNESDAFGGLADLQQIDIRNNREASLAAIDRLIETAIDKAAVIGSIENRIDIQKDFSTKLKDALDAGIGALVDADMNRESARLQALQVQQQLGVQALSIANGQPQIILSLFR